MKLTPSLEKIYTQEQLTARQAQELAHLISWGPVVFQVARLMIRYRIFELLAESDQGMTVEQLCQHTGLSNYAVTCLMEAALTMQTVLVDTETDRYTLAKTGWFLLNDPLIRADIDFNHDVNYEGWFHLDKALEEQRPAGLEHFGPWPTIYEGLSQLPEHVRNSWFGFDHYYSDHSFNDALKLIFANGSKHILDVGGNTGKFARAVTDYHPQAEVTVCDLPQQLEMLRQQTTGHHGEARIHCHAMNLLDHSVAFPSTTHYDIVWMSQFLDCFGETDIVSILQRAATIIDNTNRLYIMETLWDRQKYTPAALSLTMTSLYFTAMANGNSKMYSTDQFLRLIAQAGLEVETIHDNIGMGGHSIIICKKA